MRLLLIVALVALVIVVIVMVRGSGPRVTHITRRREVENEDRDDA